MKPRTCDFEKKVCGKKAQNPTRYDIMRVQQQTATVSRNKTWFNFIPIHSVRQSFMLWAEITVTPVGWDAKTKTAVKQDSGSIKMCP